MLPKLRIFFHRLFHFIWTLFLSGLLTILPLTLTVALFSVSFSLLKSWLSPIAQLQPAILQRIPHAEILIVIAFIFLLGFILNVLLLRSIIHFVEELISRIPIIRPIYSGIKQLVQAFSSQDKDSFKQVVLIEFPRKGMFSIGFLTSELPAQLQPDSKTYVNIFVPTTPNPTTGYLIIVPQEEVRIIDITRQEAMALIISGGIILPEKFSVK